MDTIKSNTIDFINIIFDNGKSYELRNKNKFSRRKKYYQRSYVFHRYAKRKGLVLKYYDYYNDNFEIALINPLNSFIFIKNVYENSYYYRNIRFRIYVNRNISYWRGYEGYEH